METGLDAAAAAAAADNDDDGGGGGGVEIIKMTLCDNIQNMIIVVITTNINERCCSVINRDAQVFNFLNV